MNGWQMVQLKDVAKPISRPVFVEVGNSYRTLGVRWWGMGAYERETIDGSRTAAKYLSIVREGDLIINKIWVRHGSVAIVTKEVDGCVGSGEFPTFELDNTLIHPLWIHWQTKMKSFWEKCEILSRGTSGKNRIRPEKFLEIEIPLPPLLEQKCILAYISELSNRISATQSLQMDALMDARALQFSVQGNVFKSIKDKITFGDIFIISSGGAWGDLDDSEGTGVLRPNNISPIGELVFENIKYRSVAKEKVQKLKLIDGDIIMTKSNSLELVGNSAIFSQPQSNQRNYIASNFLQFIRFDTSLYDPKYIWYYLMSPVAKSYFQTNARGTSPSLQNLNGEIIANLPLPIVPIDKQQMLVIYLDGIYAQVTKLRKTHVETQKELTTLMPSILDKAFKRELLKYT